MILREAPAKVNLSLRVLRRRDDRFHEIATRMAPLMLADTVTIERLNNAADGTVALTCDDLSVPSDETNLAVKAVRALERHTGLLPAVRIHLEKRIPHGAGLGGGSSDAAAVILGLTELLSLSLSADAIAPASAAVGSDVPFFLHGCACDCTGRGEVVTRLPDFRWRPRILLVKPPFGVSTPQAYRRWEKAREVPGLPYAPQPSPGGDLVNDLERPMFEKYPVLGTHYQCRAARGWHGIGVLRHKVGIRKFGRHINATQTYSDPNRHEQIWDISLKMNGSKARRCYRNAF